MTNAPSEPEVDVGIGAEIKHWLKLLVIATVAMFLVLSGFGVIQFSTTNTIREVAKTSKEDAERLEKALCSLRDDLEVRIKASQSFLEQNPEGIPGVPRPFIQDGIDNQQRTVLALSPLHCGERSVPSSEPGP